MAPPLTEPGVGIAAEAATDAGTDAGNSAGWVGICTDADAGTGAVNQLVHTGTDTDANRSADADANADADTDDTDADGEEKACGAGLVVGGWTTAHPQAIATLPPHFQPQFLDSRFL